MQVNTPLNPHPVQQTHQGNPNSSSQATYSTSRDGAATQHASDASDQQKEGGRRRFKEVKDTPPLVQPYNPFGRVGGKHFPISLIAADWHSDGSCRTGLAAMMQTAS